MTDQAWAEGSRTTSMPVQSRTQLRDPSQPTTYLARTVRSCPCGPRSAYSAK